MWKQHGQSLGDRPQGPKGARILMAPTKSLWCCTQVILWTLLDSYSLIPGRAPGPVLKKKGDLLMSSREHQAHFLSSYFQVLGQESRTLMWVFRSKAWGWGWEMGLSRDGFYAVRLGLPEITFPIIQPASFCELHYHYLPQKPRFSMLSLDSHTLSGPTIFASGAPHSDWKINLMPNVDFKCNPVY